jgi:hypothetical protein
MRRVFTFDLLPHIFVLVILGPLRDLLSDEFLFIGDVSTNFEGDIFLVVLESLLGVINFFPLSTEGLLELSTDFILELLLH